MPTYNVIFVYLNLNCSSNKTYVQLKCLKSIITNMAVIPMRL